MRTTRINGLQLAEMAANGYRNLKRNIETVDNLNVFPVPDGDTGTNMSMTLGGGVSAIAGEGADVGTMMRKFSRGTLLAARGNSGVILSQFVRGMANGAEGKTELSVADFSEVMRAGVECAYQAVIRPVEGTILTVMREGAEFVEKYLSDISDFEDCFRRLIGQMKYTLNKTPELLPVLKEAGVVDSGGAGFVCIFEGMEMALRGEFINETETGTTANFLNQSAVAFGPDSVLEYGYCTEFILQLLHAKTDIAAFRLEPVIAWLESVGESIVAVQDGDLVKVHVHTFEPEKVIAYARQYGEFVTIKIENMSVQHNESVAAQAEEKKLYAVVAVTSGQGVADYFRQIGVDAIIEGGQTQNPSAEDFLRAFNTLHAEHIVVLPNNSNVVMTAKQAAALYEGADVRVIATRSIAEGYSALSMMDPTAQTVDELVESMTDAIEYVTTGYVTTATRDTHMNGLDIHQGDWIGLDDETIRADAADKVTAALELLHNLPEIDEKQVLTVFVGKDVSDEELEAFQEAVEEELPLIETGFVPGGQEVYAFIFSVE